MSSARIFMIAGAAVVAVMALATQQNLEAPETQTEGPVVEPPTTMPDAEPIVPDPQPTPPAPEPDSGRIDKSTSGEDGEGGSDALDDVSDGLQGTGSAPGVSGAGGAGGSGGLSDLATGGGATARPRITGSGYGIFDKTSWEDPRFGLYSYVLAPHDSEAFETFVSRLMAKTQPASALVQAGAPPRQLNVFYMPVQDTDALPVLSAITPDQLTDRYDHILASRLLLKICEAEASRSLDHCRSGVLTDGPFVVSYLAPIAQTDVVAPPYLFLDLTGINPKAYGEYIRALKAQVLSDDYAGGEKLNTVRLGILNFLSDVSDLLPALKEEVTKALIVKGDKKG